MKIWVKISASKSASAQNDLISMVMSSNPTQTAMSGAHTILEKLDAEIVQLEAKLLALKQTRNRHAPISRLHPEILQDIFFFAQSLSDCKGKMSLGITWVCHRWRQLGHNTSSLWSYINFTHLEWVEVALSRTKERDLKFDFLNSEGGPVVKLVPSFDLIQLCLGYLSRINSFRLDVTADHDLQTSLLSVPQWTIPAPRLRELYLARVWLPHNTFSGVFSSLQTLNLTGCMVDWDTLPVISGLTELTIIDPPIKAPFKSMIQILDVVRLTLEVLVLRLVVDASTVLFDRLSERIRLPRLVLLGVDEGDPHVITQLLRHMSLPRSADLELLALQCRWGELDLIPELVASRNIKQWPVDSLHIDVQESYFTLHIVEDWAGLVDVVDDDEGVKTSIQLDLGFERRIQAIPFFTDLPIRPIKKVGIRRYKGQDIETLTFIGALGTVEDLIIQPEALDGFITFIDARSADFNAAVLENRNLDWSVQEVTAQTTLSFSNLQRLIIAGDGITTNYCPSDEDLQELHTWLKWRTVYGFRLKLLVFRQLSLLDIAWVEDWFVGVVQEVRLEDVVERDSTIVE